MTPRAYLIPLALSLLALGAPAAAQGTSDAGEAGAALLEKVAPSIVNVRFVLKLEVTAMGQVVQNKEERSQTTGVVLDASGLILIPNSAISADRVNKMLAASGREGIDVSITPTDLKVIFDGGEEEHAAFLAATDRDLDLAFLQLEKPDAVELTPVTFAGGAPPAIGTQVLQVARLSEGFDFAPVFSTGWVAGKIKKPRKALAVAGGLGALGLPVFGLDGAPLGILTALESGVQESAGPMDPGGVGGRPFLIPGKALRGIIQQAVARAKEVAAERAKDGGAGAEATPSDKDGGATPQPGPAPNAEGDK
jgi:hypothetical protein